MKRYILILLIMVLAGTAMAQSHVSDLVVTPTDGGIIKWYNASTGGTQYTDPANTALVNNQIYYASQILNGAESTGRIAITATAIPLPTFTVQPGATATLNTDVIYTTQSGKSNYVWNVPGVLNTDYSITSGGTGSTDNTITLKWLTASEKTVTINYTTNGCTAASATSSIATSFSGLYVVTQTCTDCSSLPVSWGAVSPENVVASPEIPFGYTVPTNTAKKFSGNITIPTAGNYYFRVYTDDGVRITIGGDIILVYNAPHDGAEPVVSASASSLNAQKYSLVIEYFNGITASKLNIQYSLDNENWTTIPTGWYTL